jgi:hypothetical protein
METDKNFDVASNDATDAFDEDVRAHPERLGTLADQHDMWRMGKQPRLRVSKTRIRP